MRLGGDDTLTTKRLATITLVCIAAFIAIYSLLFFLVDAPVNRALYDGLHGSDFVLVGKLAAKAFDTKVWAGLTALAGFAGFVLYRLQRRPVLARPYLIFSASLVLALATAGMFKFVLARYRPSELFAHGRYGFHFFSREHEHNSTPSGHTTGAFAGCLGAAFGFNLGGTKWVLVSIATFISITRVIVTAHYPSDVLFGAFVGTISALWSRQIIDWWYERRGYSDLLEQ